MATTKKEAHLNIRIDPDLKHDAQIVANDMGIDLSTAVTMFLNQMVKDHALPFTPTSLPIDTLQAIKKETTQKSSKSIARRTICGRT